VLFMAGVAYFFLAHALISSHGKKSTLAAAIGKDWKGKISVIIYAIGIGISFLNEWIAFTLYALVAAIWFVPDQRIEKNIAREKEE